MRDPDLWNRGRLTQSMESSSIVYDSLTIKQTFTKTRVKVEFFVPGVLKSVIYFCEPSFLKYYKSIFNNDDWHKYLLW